MSDWKPWYMALKNHDPEIYQKTLNYMEGVTLQNSVSTKVAAQYEVAAVMLVCELLGVRP